MHVVRIYYRVDFIGVLKEVFVSAHELCEVVIHFAMCENELLIKIGSENLKPPLSHPYYVVSFLLPDSSGLCRFFFPKNFI